MLPPIQWPVQNKPMLAIRNKVTSVILIPRLLKCELESALFVLNSTLAKDFAFFHCDFI